MDDLEREGNVPEEETNNREKPNTHPDAVEKPQIYGVVQGASGITLTRRSFLKAAAAAGLMTTLPGPVHGADDPPQKKQMFEIIGAFP